MGRLRTFAQILPHILILMIPLVPQITAAEEVCQNDNGALDVTLNLRDGSRLVASLPRGTIIQLATQFGTVELPLTLIAVIHFNDQQDDVKVVFQNGDTVSGLYEEHRFEIQTSFGHVTVPRSVITRLERPLTLAG